jgi:hypothetical protein
MRDPAFWIPYGPGLHVDGARAAPPIVLSPELLAATRAQVLDEGWFQLDPIVPRADVVALREAIVRLYEAGYPPVFVWVYDEAWTLFARLGALWQELIGPEWRLMPAFWAWYVQPGSEGWAPHRDRPDNVVLREDWSPLFMSAWIPLTPALPSNSCMYLLPMAHGTTPVPMSSLHHIKTLMAAPGAVMGWNGQIVHWGGKSSPNAPHPRISLSIELQSATIPPLQGEKLYGPGDLPGFEERLLLIGRQIGHYEHMASMTTPLRMVGRALRGWKPPPTTTG